MKFDPKKKGFLLKPDLLKPDRLIHWFQWRVLLLVILELMLQQKTALTKMMKKLVHVGQSQVLSSY